MIVCEGLPTTKSVPWRAQTPRALLVGRGPWAQNIMRSLDELKVSYTVCGKETALYSIYHARECGNTHVIIATPLSTHCNLITEVLHDSDESRPVLPIFAEKPLALSVHEVEVLKERWLRNGQPKFLVDSVHLFAAGVEAMYKLGQRYDVTGLSFGGPGPVRPDCSPVWDYGWHPLSIIGALNPHRKLDPQEWFGEPGDDGQFCVDGSGWGSAFDVSNKLEHKFMGGIVRFPAHQFILTNEGWMRYTQGLSQPTPFPFSDAPPLKRALQLFLDDSHDWKNDYRFGFDLPLAVTRVLEKLCPSTGPATPSTAQPHSAKNKVV